MTDKTLNSDDDLSPMQEYTIAGIVILLFGLLYWFINHGWNSGAGLLSGVASQPVITTTADTSAPGSISDLSASKSPATNTGSTGKQERNRSETEVITQTTSPAGTVNTGLAAQAQTAKPVPEDTAKTEAMQAEILQLKAENSALKQQAGADRIKTGQTTPTTATSPPQTEQPIQTVVRQTSAEDTYPLPNGTEVTLAATGMEQSFKQAILKQETNKTLVFDNIYFDTGSIALSPASDHQIRAIAALMHKHPGIKVMLRGHTDNIGLPQANAQLSLLRANSVGLALVNLGIDRQRIRIMGMGDTNPLAGNATEEGRRKNRRIDISILE